MKNYYLPLSLFLTSNLLLSFSANAIHTDLPAAAPPAFLWSSFGVEGGKVQSYNNLDGTPNGTAYIMSTPILDDETDPNETNPEEIGSVTWEYALWKGTPNNGGAVDRAGMAMMGGFNLTDTNDVGTNFSFLQIFKDRIPKSSGGTGNTWTIDGGGVYGKVNGQVAGWEADLSTPRPGWNFSNSSTTDTVAYDYFDNPFDLTSSGPDTLDFETALVCYKDGNLHIAGDWTWGFTVNGTGGVNGRAITSQSIASNNMMNLYSALLPPDGSISNINFGSCHELVPEPSSVFGLISAGLGLLGAAKRRKLYQK